eukprot:gene14793-56950_t
MWVFTSDRIGGPYAPLSSGFMLSTGAWLASWCRGPAGERLFSNYITPEGRGRDDVWMLPMRRAVVDGGRLRISHLHRGLITAPHCRWRLRMGYREPHPATAAAAVTCPAGGGYGKAADVRTPAWGCWADF